MKKLLILIVLLALSYALSCCKKAEICGQKYTSVWQVEGNLVFAQEANYGRFEGISEGCLEYRFDMMNPWAILAGDQVRHEGSYNRGDTIFFIYATYRIDTVAFIPVEHGK